VKIVRVVANHRQAQLELVVRGGRVYPFPYAKLDPRPTRSNRLREVFVDPELGNEGVTFVLSSGDEGAVHIEHALEYNLDPSYLGELLRYRLTLEARQRVLEAGLSRRQLARHLQTSVPQLYRLLDPKNTRKSIAQLLALLHALGCEVELVVRDVRPRPRPSASMLQPTIRFGGARGPRKDHRQRRLPDRRDPRH
jgi:predicted XRE-type DNA-binding protein